MKKRIILVTIILVVLLSTSLTATLAVWRNRQHDENNAIRQSSDTNISAKYFLYDIVTIDSVDYAEVVGYNGIIATAEIPLTTTIDSVEYTVIGIGTTFEGNNLQAINKLIIPSSVKYVKQNALLNCTSLKEIEFRHKTNTLAIGNNAFMGCTDLQKLTFKTTTDDVTFNDVSAENYSIQKTFFELPFGTNAFVGTNSTIQTQLNEIKNA